jgi:putative oxidoreductase
MQSVIRARAKALDLLGHVQFVAPLLLRIALGLEFVPTGLGKVQHLDKVTAFFVELHIPMPGFNAVLVAWSEILCGGAILLGLLTRLATLPLVVSMLVALVTAQRDKIFSLDLFGLEEFHYLVMLVALAIIGPGAVAVDSALARALGKGADSKSAATASPTRA